MKRLLRSFIQKLRSVNALGRLGALIASVAALVGLIAGALQIFSTLFPPPSIPGYVGHVGITSLNPGRSLEDFFFENQGNKVFLRVDFDAGQSVYVQKIVSDICGNGDGIREGQYFSLPFAYDDGLFEFIYEALDQGKSDNEIKRDVGSRLDCNTKIRVLFDDDLNISVSHAGTGMINYYLTGFFTVETSWHMNLRTVSLRAAYVESDVAAITEAKYSF